MHKHRSLAPVALITMGNVQSLITAVNESKLPDADKRVLRDKLDAMSRQLRVCTQLVVR